MKKFVLAAVAAAATIAATPAAAQSFGHRDSAPAARHVAAQSVTRGVQGNRAVQVNRNTQANRGTQVNRNVQANRSGQHSQQRRWNAGERFDSRYAANYQVIRSHDRLYAAPRGYQWVRSGNDAVLVGIASGIVGTLMANLF